MKTRPRHITADAFAERMRKLSERTDRQAQRVSDSLRRAAESLQSDRDGASRRNGAGSA